MKLFIIFVVLISTSCSVKSEIPMQIDEYICNCPIKKIPVCASNGQTYTNACVFGCAWKYFWNTLNVDITIVKYGTCDVPQEQPCVCTSEFNPVCGSDGVTYPNMCSFDCSRRRWYSQNRDITITNYGSCNTVIGIKPLCGCKPDYQPVCGSDGMTYNNLCDLRCSGKNIDLVGYGRCEISRESTSSSCNCPGNLEPVCGTNGKTYYNSCYFECERRYLMFNNVFVQISRYGYCEQ